MALRKAPLFTPYVVVWALFGTLSLGLLGVIGLVPEWLEDLKPAWSVTDPQSNQGQRAAARLAADLNAVKDSVAKIQLDLAKVKTDVASQGTETKSVSAQVTALEQRVASGSTIVKGETPPASAPQPATGRQALAPSSAAPVTGPAAAPVAALAASAAPLAIVTPQLPAAQIDGAQIPATQIQAALAAPAAPAQAVRAAKVINGEAAARTTANSLETGSLNAAAKAPADAISFGPAVVKAAPQPMGIKISSGELADSLRLSWSLLAEKHGDTLKGLEPRYVSGGDALNPNFDLVAGPLKSKAEAAKVCKALAAKGVPCTVGAFTGEAL